MKYMYVANMLNDKAMEIKCLREIAFLTCTSLHTFSTHNLQVFILLKLGTQKEALLIDIILTLEILELSS